MNKSESSIASGLLAGLSILAMALIVNEFQAERVEMKPLSPAAAAIERRAEVVP